MYDGTLVESWEALVTFQQMIILSDANGIVDITPQALSRQTGIPIQIIRNGIIVLEAEDIDSRSPASKGKRIERLDDHRDWGWQIVNYSYYCNLINARDKREKDRSRIEKKRKEISSVAQCREVSQSVANVAHRDVDVDVLKDMPKSEDLSFHEFWDKYPRKLNRKKSEAIWKRIPKSDRLKILTDIESRFTNMDSQYIPYPSSYLNQERWNDEPENNSQDEQTKFAI